MPNLHMDALGQAVFLGALGWEWPEWAQRFYPEDMPEDWRLTFYNTQFNCVFLPASQWRGVSEGTLEQWAEDTHEQFLFLLEGGEGEAIPRPLQARALCISSQDGRISWFDGETDLKRLAESLGQRGNGPRFLISRDGNLSQVEKVRTLLGLMGMIA